ncbi:MAG: multiubiquitin domain-containing protein [Gammaproteobacteria bacterium]
MSDKPPFKFFVDAKPYETNETALTGAVIKKQAGIALQFQLYLEEEGDKPDKAISDGEAVDMRGKDKHFFAVPPATFG